MLLAIQNDTLSTNLFSYCSNNPVNRSDPNGYMYKFNQKWNSVNNMGFILNGLTYVASTAMGIGGGIAAIKEILRRNTKGVVLQLTKTLLLKAGISLAGTTISSIVGALEQFLDFNLGTAIAKAWDKIDAYPGNGICDFKFGRKKK